MQMKDIIDRFGKERLGEVIRFGVVGVIATLIQFMVYWLLIRWLNPSVSMTIGYGVSLVFNYLASTYFTFRVKASARRGAGFLFSHGVNYLLQMITLNFFLWLGVSKELAPIPMFCVCVPVNFLLVRFFLKR
jgi:putative flippase GtrA